MTPSTLVFAAAALIPAMTSPAESSPRFSAAAALAVAMCDGSSLVLPLENGAPLPAGEPSCCAKGCRGDKRKRIDRKQ